MGPEEEARAVAQRARWLHALHLIGDSSVSPRWVVVSVSNDRPDRPRSERIWRDLDAWRLPDPTGGQAVLEAMSRELGRLGVEHNVYISARAFSEPHRSNAYALASSVLWADCDTVEAADRLARFVPRPQIVIRSGRPGGGGLHAYWILDRSLPSPEHRELSARLAGALGADPAAARPAQPTRVPLTRNHKWPGAPVATIARFEVERVGDFHSVDAVSAALPPMSGGDLPTRSVARAGSGGDLSQARNALKALDPATYVPALTNRSPTPSGYVVCPFPHPHSPTGADRNPSLKIHSDGWHCYGCGRYGDVIALEGELCGFGPAPTGRDYSLVVARLCARFGIALDARSGGHSREKPAARHADGPTQARRGPNEARMTADRLALAGGGAMAVPWGRLGVGAAAAAAALAALVVMGALLVLGFVGGGATTHAAYTPSALADRDIPSAYMRLYVAAAATYGLDWSILAAIGKVECDHGRLPHPACRHHGAENRAGAGGPAQFLDSTWSTYGTDGDGDGDMDRWDPADATFAMARYLRASGASGDYGAAIFAYNHDASYVSTVLSWAERYRGAYQGAVATDVDEELLANPRISIIHAAARRDIESGAVDPRALTLLAAIGRRHSVVVTAIASDHRPGTNHEAGRAIDIASVDSLACRGHRDDTCGRLGTELALIEGPLRPTELIYAIDLDGPRDSRAFARADHADHLHIGWDR